MDTAIAWSPSRRRRVGWHRRPDRAVGYELGAGLSQRYMARRPLRRGHGHRGQPVSPFDVRLSDITVLQPDLAYFDREGVRLISTQRADGAPTIAIEILSPATEEFDRGPKRMLYARHGVPEMWIVDADESTIEVHDLRAGRISRAGDTLTTSFLPGLQILVSDISRI